MLAAVTDERDGPRIDARILGLLDLRVDGESVEIATRRQRALLVLLLLNVGRVVSTERLIDQLWDGTPPPQGAVTLRSYVSNLRQALGATGALGSALVTRGPGYLIDLPAESVDAMRLRTLTQTGRDLLRQGAVADALATLDEAVGLWTGDPLAEVSDHQFAQSIVAQLTETYLAAMEGRFEAMLAAGRHADALPALDGFAADHPLREEPQALLMLALYRCGRTPDALEVHRRFRVMLDDELGILPSSRMDSLLQRILSQDPDLDPPPAAPEAIAPPVATTPSPAAASTETAPAGARRRRFDSDARRTRARARRAASRARQTDHERYGVACAVGGRTRHRQDDTARDARRDGASPERPRARPGGPPPRPGHPRSGRGPRSSTAWRHASATRSSSRSFRPGRDRWPSCHLRSPAESESTSHRPVTT